MSLLRKNWKILLIATVWFVLLTTRGTCATNTESPKPKSVPDIIDRLLDEEEYDARFRPNYGKAAVDVSMAASILSMPELDSSKQELGLNIFLKQTWNDSRLAFEGHEKSIKLGVSQFPRIWSPDTFVTNELSSTRHDVTMPTFMIKLSPNGEVYKSARYTIRTSCPMHFQYFPFDEQTCTVAIESYCCTGEDIRYKWAKGNNSLKLIEQMPHKEFKIIGHRTIAAHVSFSEAGYSRLAIELRFRRFPGRYIVEFFYPCVFLSLLSLLALFVDDPRMAVLINVLTMGFTILFLAVSSGALEGPFISYATALDTFSSLTNTIVFISLTLSVLALHLNKKNYGPELIKLSDFGKLNGRVRLDNQMDDEVNLYTNSSSNGQQSQQREQPAPSNKAAAAVSMCGGLFSRFLPFLKYSLVLIYLLANLIFWTTVPYAQQTHKDVLLSDNWNVL